MTLNGEERMQHELFKQQQYARPTLEQLEIAKLEEELQRARESLNYLDDYVDKITDKIDRINGHIRYYEVHRCPARNTLDAIRAVLR